MARVVIYLLEPEMNALNQLAQQEYRPVKAQAALIIRNELKRLGMVGSQPENHQKEFDRPSESGSGGAA
jgi:hypothetical protein